MSFTPAPCWRDVYIAAGARAISYCGDYLAATALALTLVARGDSGYGVAALLLAGVLPMVLLGRLAGGLADRVDSRKLLVATGLAQAVVCAVLAYTGSTAMIVALVAVLTAGVAITQPTVSALVPDMVGKENLPRAMSISQTAASIGMLAGPALGGLLVGAYGMHLPLLLDAATFLAIAGAGLALRTRRGGRTATVPAAAGAPRPDGEAAPAIAWRLRQDRLLLTLITAMASVVAAVTAVSVVEIFFVRETLGASETMYGVVSAVWTLGMLVGAVPFGKVGRGGDLRLLTILLLLLAGVSVIVLGSAGVRAAAWLLPLYLVGGALNSGLNVLSGVVLIRRIPGAVRGRVLGTFGAIVSSANVLGYALGGLLMPFSTPRVLLAGTGAAGLIVAVVFLVPVLAGWLGGADQSPPEGDPAVTPGREAAAVR
jgi:MFS family permease